MAHYIVVREAPTGSMPVGAIIELMGTKAYTKAMHTAMGGELALCEGQWLDCEAYSELYAVIGNMYTDSIPVHDDDGAICMDNDAVAHWENECGAFRLPDLRARVVT